MNTNRLVLVLLCTATSYAWSNGSACNVQLSREEAIHLLAQGYVRETKHLSGKAASDAVEEARRGISAQLEKGHELQIKRGKDCTFTIIYQRKGGGYAGGGFLVSADKTKRLVDVFGFR